MSDELRTTVLFKSTAFNTTERRPYFINDCCFGDDVARWLIARLRANGVETDPEPGQEDFGWYFGYRTQEGKYCFVLGYRPDDPAGDWIGTIERDCGLIASLLGGRSRGISQRSLDVIHEALHGATELTAVSWHRRSDFERGDETKGAPNPAAG
jgi:hypothetical protein